MTAPGFADAPGGVDNPLLDYLGIELVDVGAGHATFQIDVDQRHLNRQGSLQGGVAATLLDAACGYAGLAAHEGDALGNAVTVMLNISYIRKVGTGRASLHRPCHARRAARCTSRRANSSPTQAT